MNIVLFGATGMVGQGVLRECLLDPTVERVLAVGRSSTGQAHAKLQELIVPDLSDLSAFASSLRALDACCFCLGVSAAGLSEEGYARVSYDLTVRAAELLVRLNPTMTFMYVSGAGTDSTEHGQVMWARVKGRTENALLRLPFKRAYMFRPGVIQPLHGITSRTTAYRVFYGLTKPLLPLVKALAPRSITTTEELGRAMLVVAKRGYAKPILEMADITSLGGA